MCFILSIAKLNTREIKKFLPSQNLVPAKLNTFNFLYQTWSSENIHPSENEYCFFSELVLGFYKIILYFWANDKLVIAQYLKAREIKSKI